MKELDLLKKDWKKNSNSFEQISESEIYKMIHKKSSSIVMWIFIISIIEFLFWTAVYIYQNDAQHHKFLQKYGIEELEFWVNVFNYVVLTVFIYLFYKNYKTISTTDTTHQLMENILKTRRSVKIYIWYNYVMLFIAYAISLYIVIKFSPADAKTGHITTLFTKFAMWSIAFWVFYQIVYGILLKKLHKNHNELEKIEL
ncbi:MAG: hypothetical protein V4548_04085 [Bacteroidota bacterium]